MGRRPWQNRERLREVELGASHIEAGRFTLPHTAKDAAACGYLPLGFAAIQRARTLRDSPIRTLLVLDILNVRRGSHTDAAHFAPFCICGVGWRDGLD